MSDWRGENQSGNSYNAEREGHGLCWEVERLADQAQLSWDVELRRLKILGISDGQNVLELGCGPGHVTWRLAEAFPVSCIIALDIDRRMLRLAQESVAHRKAQVFFVQSSASATGLASNSFDFAISRYLFQHIPDPVGAAIEVHRVLKPGGSHVIIDIDDGIWGLVQPEFEEFRRWHALRAHSQREHGGNRFVGRHLWRILKQAGYSEIELDVFAYHSDALGLSSFATQLDPVRFLPLLDAGIIDSGQFLRASALHHQFLHCSDPLVLFVGLIARGQKPW
jgi:ubiquinone/menaquinone biosynthesis C-methylase UbiE